jgi:hypothetical protein
MTMKKIVDGKPVDMTPAEDAALQAEWGANAAKAMPAPAPSIEERLAALEAAARAAGWKL